MMKLCAIEPIYGWKNSLQAGYIPDVFVEVAVGTPSSTIWPLKYKIIKYDKHLIIV